jgi:hypothetical protein
MRLIFRKWLYFCKFIWKPTLMNTRQLAEMPTYLLDWDIFLFIKTTTPYALSTSFTILTSALTTG